MQAPVLSTALFTVLYAGTQLVVAHVRIFSLHLYEKKWTPEFAWAEALVFWPILALIAGALFAIAATAKDPPKEPWLRAGIGAVVSALAAWPLLSGDLDAWHQPWSLWAVLILGPLGAGIFAGANIRHLRRAD